MLGSIVTIRRNVRILHDSQQVCEQRNEEMLANQTKIMDQLTRMESQMERLAFNIDMTSIDISGYFPIRNNEMIYAFLSNEDGTLEEKKKLFEYMMYTSVTTLKTMKRAFGESLKTTLFSREYIATHRWPSAG